MNQNESKQKAFNYYCKGLNSKEIGKLLDLSYRTIQNWMHSEKWKQKRTPNPIHLKALELFSGGESYKAIAKKFNVSRSTVSSWIKKARK